MRRPLTEDELVTELDGWAGRPVAVRVVAAGDELVAVVVGRLGARSDAKHPSLFWPLEAGAGVETVERSGIYLHGGLVEDPAIHTGDSVVEWRQAGATVNIRLL